MDRKSKIWIILLIVLLIASLAGVALFKTQLDTAKTAAAALQTELETANATIGTMTTDLETANATIGTMTTDLETANATIGTMTTDLETANATIGTLTTDLETANSTIGSLTAELENKTDEVTTKTAEGETAEGETAEGETAEGETAEGETAEGETAEGQTSTEQIEGAITDMSAVATVAEGKATTLAEQLAAIDTAITELGGTVPETTASDVSFDDVADAMSAIEAVDAETISANVDAILNSDVTDAEKLEALLPIREEIAASIANVDAATETVQGSVDKLSTDLTTITTTQGDLETAQTTVAELQAQLEASNTRIAELEALVGEGTDTTDLEAARTENAELQTALDIANAEVAALEAQLETLTAETGARISELEAYYVEHVPTEGQALNASGMGNTVTVAADGVTAAWDYTNTVISGNDVTASLVIDDQTVYTSEKLAVGSSLSEITLSETLTSGSYEGMAVTTVTDDNGEIVSVTRVPVIIIVE